MTSVSEQTFAVALTIPDNEAFTALETLRRLGLQVGQLRRADIWTFSVAAAAADTLAETIATIEAVFNPNKHVMEERPGSRPLAGEVWIAPREEAVGAHVGGRLVAGVRGVQRRVAWQLLDDAGAIVDPAVLERAVETFLCNSAFQKAIR